MKKKDLFAKIKETAIQEMPDIRERIDIAKINIEADHEEVKAPFNLRKAFSYTFASIFILISGFFGYNLAITRDDLTPLNSETAVVGFQTVSAASLLDSFNLADLSASDDFNSVIELSEVSTVEESIEDPIIAQLNLINRYLNMAETVLANNNEYVYKNVESDNPDYEYAYVYNGTDLRGYLINYRAYYNLVEEDGSQIEEGIIIHDGNVFEYRSMLTEQGDQLIYHYRIMTDAENYVDVNQSSTEKGQVFIYRIVENGEVVNNSQVALIANRNNLRANIQIAINDDLNISLDVSRDNSNQESQMLNVKYGMVYPGGTTQGKMTVELEFNQETNAYQYKYAVNDEEVVVVARSKKGSQKTSEEDFDRGNSGNNQYATNNQQSNGNSPSGDVTTNTDSSNGNSENTNSDNGNSTNNSDNTNNNNSNHSTDFQTIEEILFQC